MDWLKLDPKPPTKRRMRIVITVDEPPDKCELLDFVRDKVSEWQGHLHPEYNLGPVFKNAVVKEEVI